MEQVTSKEENICYKTKKTLKFVWRHLFTLVILSSLISVFIEGPLNWKNGFFMIATAVFLDWAKQFIKFSPRDRRAHNAFQHTSIQPFRDQWWDSSLRGTSAHFLNNMDNNRYN